MRAVEAQLLLSRGRRGPARHGRGCSQTTAGPPSKSSTVWPGVAPRRSASRCERTLAGAITETSRSIPRSANAQSRAARAASVAQPWPGVALERPAELRLRVVAGARERGGGPGAHVPDVEAAAAEPVPVFAADDGERPAAVLLPAFEPAADDELGIGRRLGMDAADELHRDRIGEERERGLCVLEPRQPEDEPLGLDLDLDPRQSRYSQTTCRPQSGSSTVSPGVAPSRPATRCERMFRGSISEIRLAPNESRTAAAASVA